MPGSDNTIFYIIIFGIIFIPYIFLAFFLNKPQHGIRNFEFRNIPGMFRLLWGILEYFTESLGSSLKKIQPKQTQKMQNFLLVANIKMDVEYIFAAQILLGFLGALVTVLIFLLFSRNWPMMLLIMLCVAAFGYLYPVMLIQSIALKRQQQIMRALPFAIDLIASAMRSGIDFTAAVRYYVDTEKATSPLAYEFEYLLRQLELGKTRIDALNSLIKRIQHDSFTAFASAVIHGFEVGASIVETMKMQAEDMRRERFNIAEKKAARATSMMILPIALFIMPAMFLIIGTPVFIKVMGSGLGGLME